MRRVAPLLALCASLIILVVAVATTATPPIHLMGSLTASMVPEPGSVLLFGAGLLGLAGHLRRQQAK